MSTTARIAPVDPDDERDRPALDAVMPGRHSLLLIASCLRAGS